MQQAPSRKHRRTSTLHESAALDLLVAGKKLGFICAEYLDAYVEHRFTKAAMKVSTFIRLHAELPMPSLCVCPV